jgi:enoyl-CoA hydratase/carnithine racemase
LAPAYERASSAMVENMLEPDSNEGISAFLEKREPKWQL